MGTQIEGRQIKDGAITDAKVAAGAGIANSKLANGADYILRTGTVAMTGAFNAGSQLMINVLTPASPNDAANKAYVDSEVANVTQMFDSKGSVRAASTGNLLLSNPGTAVVDGITLVNGERVLLKNQTAPAENGIYVFATSSTPLVRATDMNAWAEIPGALVTVEEGTTQADTIWLSTANSSGTIGTTAITWQGVGVAGGLLASNFVKNETPTGSVNGSNTVFSLANTPVVGSVEVYLNGLLQDVGGANDYTITGATITMVTAPTSGEKLRVHYIK